MQVDFSYSVKTQKSIEKAVEDLTANLKEVGFGVIGSFNFKEIFQKKGIDYPDEYRLLEVCNPSAAKQVLQTNPEVGLLLPCTIAVYQKEGKNRISLARPTTLLSSISDRNLQKVGQDVEQKLVQVIENSK